MSEDSADKSGKSIISRRNFLKLLGLGGTGVTLALVNSGLYNLLQGETAAAKGVDNQKYPLSEFIDSGYPTISWTRANLANAVKLLDGQIIKSGASFSLLDTLIPDPNKIDYYNTDAAKGFVFGLDPGNPFERAPASGICKAATDLFRCSLSSPIKILESFTHNRVYSKHPYFKNYPYGTDAAIYLDPEAGIRYDLVLKNPFDFPLVLNYKLYNKKGDRVKPEDLMEKLSFDDYSIGLWIKYIEGMQQVNLPVPPGVVPNLIGTKDITSQIYFTPQDKSSVVPGWRVSLQGPVKLKDGQYELSRTLDISGEQESVYKRVSNYR